MEDTLSLISSPDSIDPLLRMFANVKAGFQTFIGSFRHIAYHDEQLPPYTDACSSRVVTALTALRSTGQESVCVDLVAKIRQVQRDTVEDKRTIFLDTLLRLGLQVHDERLLTRHRSDCHQ